MYYKIFKIPVLNWLFRELGAIPIAGAKEDADILRESYVKIQKALENGEIVCIFPEGKITKDGEMNEFKSGIERIINQTPVPVIPIALKGIYGSIFSRKHKIRLPRSLFRKITIEIGDRISPEEAKREILYDKVKELLNK